MLMWISQAIGGAADAARMGRVVDFYEKLPRGPAPQPKARGFLQWYSLRYMTGKNPSVMRTYTCGCRCEDWGGRRWLMMLIAIVHVVGSFILLGYAQNYYFHLRKSKRVVGSTGFDPVLMGYRSPQEQRALSSKGMRWSDRGAGEQLLCIYYRNATS